MVVKKMLSLGGSTYKKYNYPIFQGVRGASFFLGALFVLQYPSKTLKLTNQKQTTKKSNKKLISLSDEDQPRRSRSITASTLSTPTNPASPVKRRCSSAWGMESLITLFKDTMHVFLLMDRLVRAY